MSPLSLESRTFKILVIEDEPDMLDELLDMLRYENFEVQGSLNGQDALTQLQEHIPDLVLCDIMMPDSDYDGYQVLEAFRQDPRTASVPFIFLTAKVSKEDIRYGMNLGADDYLTKPIDGEQLLAAIYARLKRYHLIQSQSREQLLAYRRLVIHRLPHELYTPLNSIMGFSRVLARRALTLPLPKIEETSQAIYRSSLRLYRLLQNHLLYIELDLLEQDQDKRDLLTQSQTEAPAKLVAEIARQKAQAVGRELDLSLNLDNIPLQMLEKHLRSILEETLDNAFKFSQAATPVVLSTHVERNHLHLKIINLGEGISQTQIATIDAYMQFNRERQEQQGIGLGLVLVKRLLKLYGGHLHIDSIPGKYTQLELAFPLALGRTHPPTTLHELPHSSTH
jgi:two-component system sensor histidine kinase/response regulator